MRGSSRRWSQPSAARIEKQFLGTYPRPAAAYASTASGHGHTMATGDTASDPFSQPAQQGVPDPENAPASGCDDRHHAGLLPRADGTLRSSPSSQRSAVQEQEETSTCRRR